MNVLSSRVALRDRTLLDVLDLSLRFLASHKTAFTKMSACVSVPAFFVSWLAALTFGWWLGWVTAIVLASFAEAPFVALASRLVFQPTVPTREALGAGLSAIPRLFGLRVLQASGILAGAIFLVLPGFWVATLFVFATEVTVLERASVTASVSRMQRLVSGYFGDVLMAMLLFWVLCLLAVAIGSAAGSAFLEGLLQIRMRRSEDQMGGPLALFGMWLALPFLTTARFFVYLNLRTRREGWDIQTRFAAIAARAAKDGAAT